MRWLALLSGGIVVAVLLVAWMRTPSAESEVAAYLRDERASATVAGCTHVRYDSDPALYTCTIETGAPRTLFGWKVPQGRSKFCFSVPRSAPAGLAFDGDPAPIAPDRPPGCIALALDG